MLGLIAAALGVGRAIYGAVDGNQKKQRNKGYIEDSYRTAKQRLGLKQAAGRQDAAEALGARGLTSGGDVNASPIQTAMMNGQMTAQGAAPHTIGAQLASDNAVQMGLESQDLEQQHSQAERENKANYTNTLIGSVLNGAQDAMGVYNAGKELGASGTPSPIKAAMIPQPSITGIDNPGNWFGGIHGLDPLGAPGSSWNRAPSENGHGVQFNASGESNADFHV